MSIYEDYVDFYGDLRDYFDNNKGSYTDYANHYGVTDVWNQLDYPLTEGGATKYRLTPEEAAQVRADNNINADGMYFALALSGNPVTGTSIGNLNNATRIEYHPDGSVDITYVPSYQNHFNDNAAGNNGLELFAAQFHSGEGMYWGNVPGFTSGSDRGYTLPVMWEGQTFAGPNAKSEFGMAHWDYAKDSNEARILPTPEIFSLDKNDKLNVNNDFVSKGYRTQFNNLANDINNGKYKNNYEGLVKSFQDRFNTEEIYYVTNHLTGKEDIHGRPISSYIDAAYIANNIPNEERWNIEKDGAKAPLMSSDAKYFDPDYYAATNYGKDAAREYKANSAFKTATNKTLDDLDFTYKYSLDDRFIDGVPIGYFSKYYTDATKQPGFDPKDHRATVEEETIAVDRYKETVTDAEKDLLRTYGLGLGGGSYDPLSGEFQSFDDYKNSLTFAIDPNKGVSSFFETDENGNIIYDTDPETGAQTPRPKQVEIFQFETEVDENGNVLTDEEGNIKYIYETDEDGNTIYATDEEGNQILDDNGNPIPKRKLKYDIEYKVDDDGNIVYQPEYDEEGNIVYIDKLDENGNKIPRLMENGEPLRDPEGNIVYEQEIKTTDEPVIAKQTPVLNTTFTENPINSLAGSSVFNVYGAKDLEQQDKFQLLALDAFKTSYDKLKEVKKQETELSMLQGLPGYDEIYAANESIANSILGDSGIGGYLSILGYDPIELQENLENQLSGVTGIASNNSVIFNWEKWFEEELTQRYLDLNEIESTIRANLEGLDPDKALDNYEEFKRVLETTDRTNSDGTISEEWKTLLKNNGFNENLSEEEVLRQANPESWTSLMERYGLDPNTTKAEAEAAFSETVEVLDEDGEPTGEVENKYNLIYELEEDFKNGFIEDYLTPRFDQSKSMDEFIAYIDSLDPDEQNILQTEMGLTAISDVAEKYAKKKLDDIYNVEDQVFDPDFYMDPFKNNDPGWSENDAKYKDYELQKQKVAEDWEQAKTNPNTVIEGTISDLYPEGITWNDYAYYYGIDLNNKQQFAKLHYETVGQNLLFDPARDAITYNDISNFANEELLPVLEQEKITLDGNVFSEFTTPEEFADALLEGINPDENDPAWKELLGIYGIDDFTTEIEAVRELIIETLQVSGAKEIRESIKYLNEKGYTPTQERLGVSYIQREEDIKELEDPDEDEFFKLFKSYGYEGTADDFYNEFMPEDTDRGDIDLLSRALTGDFELKEISSDPFEALTQVSAYFGDDTSNPFDSAIERDEQEEQDDFGNYFDLFGDDDFGDDEDFEYINTMDIFFK
jgi:hypothetical protein